MHPLPPGGIKKNNNMDLNLIHNWSSLVQDYLLLNYASLISWTKINVWKTQKLNMQNFLM